MGLFLKMRGLSKTGSREKGPEGSEAKPRKPPSKVTTDPKKAVIIFSLCQKAYPGAKGPIGSVLGLFTNNPIILKDLYS